MRRRALTAIARLAAGATEELGTAVRQQGGASTAASAAGAARAAGLSTRAAGGAAAAAARLAPVQAAVLGHPQLGAQLLQQRGYGAAPQLVFDDQDGAAVPEGPQFATVAEAARYVQENLDQLQPRQLGALVRQCVELHFQNIGRGGNRQEMTQPLEDIIKTVISEASPLRSDGAAISYLLWGAAKMRFHLSKELREELLAAAERGLEGASQKDVSATLWALGYMRLNPSEQYWDAVGNRLFGEGLVAYMRVPDIIPAIAGVTMLPSGHAQNTICEFLIEELLKKSNYLRPREVGGIADFIPSCPQSEGRELLAERMFSQAGRLAPHLDLVAIASVLWAAVKLSYSVPSDALLELVGRAGDLLETNKGHTVPAVLWALGRLGCRVNDGVITEDFVRACIASQMTAMNRRVQPQKTTKFLNACGVLGVTPSDEELQRCLDSVVDQDFYQIDEQGHRALLRAFQGFRFWPGVDVVKARLGIQDERRPPRRNWTPRNQQRGAAQAEQVQQQGEATGAAEAEAEQPAEQQAEAEQGQPAAA